MMEIVSAFLPQANDELHDGSHSDYLPYIDVTNDKVMLNAKEFSNGWLHRKLATTREF
jgi:hypothetical protein